MKISCGHCGANLEIEDDSGSGVFECPSCHGIVELTSPAKERGGFQANKILLVAAVSLLAVQVALTLFGILSSGRTTETMERSDDSRIVSDALKEVGGKIDALIEVEKFTRSQRYKSVSDMSEKIENINNGVGLLISCKASESRNKGANENSYTSSSNGSQSRQEWDMGQIVKMLKSIKDSIGSIKSDVESIDIRMKIGK